MPLNFELVSPERQLRSGEVHQVVVPGSEGDFGVLEGHAAFMSTIRPGAIEVYETEGSAPERIFIEGGFAEVNEDGLTILAEHALSVTDIDVEQTAKDIERAEADVRAAGSESERARAERRLAVLVARRDAAAH